MGSELVTMDIVAAGATERNEEGAGAALRWKAPAAMVLVQLFQTGQILLSKVVMGHGMFAFALVAYRSALGAAFLLPLALICERCVRARAIQASAP